MICGAKEVQNKTITIRRLGQEQQQTMPRGSYKGTIKRVYVSLLFNVSKKIF